MTTRSVKKFPVVGVIGADPVLQYLVELPGQHYQAFNPGFQADGKGWVNTQADDHRESDEWGHWQGQGMNWNANCAACHMTGYQKRFEFLTDTYDSTWLAQGVGCASCHLGLEAHASAAQKGQTVATKRLTAKQTESLCASCHSRRDSLTGDSFKPGSNFEDHYRLMTAEQPGLYYPDGQIRDEVFVYGSFLGSRMHQTGVTCGDCHNPHSGKTRLPVSDNQLCLQCHQSGALGAPIMTPVAHSHHGHDSSGNQCVNCHMPKTLYMGVDARADHGFLKPDALLAQEFDAPNACTGCHTNKGIEWAVEWSERWFGEKLQHSAQRQRARILSGALAGKASVLPELIRNAAEDSNPFWRATYTALLGNYRGAPQAEAAVRSALSDKDAMVRARAVEAWAQWPDHGPPAVEQFIDDPSRQVRLAASQSLVIAGHYQDSQLAYQELKQYLNYHSDRPQGLFGLAMVDLNDGDHSQIGLYIQRAVKLDRGNPQVYLQGAVLLSRASMPDQARQTLEDGWQRFPKQAGFPYSLGLLAYEQGDVNGAVNLLEKAVALDHGHTRAWYNLALLYRWMGRSGDAESAFKKAQVNTDKN